MRLMTRMVLVIGACVALMAERALAGEPYERWYVTQMEGQKMGWMKETLVVTPEGYESVSVMDLQIRRGPGTMSVVLESRFVETLDGEPIRMVAKSQIGSSLNSTMYEFRDDEVYIEDLSAGQEITRSAALPDGEWLTPVEAADYMQARLMGGAERIVVRTIDALSGLEPTTTTYLVGERTTAQGMGKSLPAIEMTLEIDTMPGVGQKVFVDLEGNLVRAITDLGGLQVTILASDKETALAEFDAPEMMASTLIESDRDLSGKMDSRRATFVLRTQRNEVPDLTVGGAQRVKRLDSGAVRVMVDLDDPVDVEAGELDEARYLEATSAANWKDPMIGELAAEAVEDVADSPIVRAHAMVKFVSEYIDDKSLDVGFATASEVCRTREGDCSEHAVLLAALLRAEGIPSRVISGLVYVPQFLGKESVFGYHMWTQALIENAEGVDEWIDLDAAYPMNALHIALDESSLADDESINSMVAVARVLGNLSIEVGNVE